nr:putative vacuolar protein sorting-associated protein 13B [Hydra vulgaris]
MIVEEQLQLQQQQQRQEVERRIRNLFRPITPEAIVEDDDEDEDDDDDDDIENVVAQVPQNNYERNIPVVLSSIESVFRLLPVLRSFETAKTLLPSSLRVARSLHRLLYLYF